MVETPGEREVNSFREGLLNWAYESNLREFPWRDTNSPYEIFVAEILLGATPAVKVESLYEDFLERYPDLDALAQANEEKLADLLEPLGLQNRRASAFIQIGEELEDCGIPDSVEELLELPYVGPYAANATLCFAFDRRRAILDANVVRVYERFFDVELDQESRGSWMFAIEVLPAEDFKTYNLALIDFGAKVCKAESPHCDACPVSDWCWYYVESEPRET